MLKWEATQDQFSEMEAAAIWEHDLTMARLRGESQMEQERLQNNVQYCLKQMDKLNVPNWAGNHALAWGRGDWRRPYRTYFKDWMNSGDYHVTVKCET